MDIAALSTMMAHANIAQQVNISVMKMSLDTGKQQMNDMIKMSKNMEQSVNTHLGNNIDVSI